MNSLISNIPVIFKIGVGVSIAGVLACLAGIVLEFRKPKQKGKVHGKKGASPQPASPGLPAEAWPCDEEAEQTFSHPSLEVFDRQRKWVSSLARTRLEFLGQRQGNGKDFEMPALNALIGRSFKIRNWDYLSQAVRCDEAIGALNISVMDRLYRLYADDSKKKIMCELLYLLDCANGGALPLEEGADLIPAELDIRISLCRLLDRQMEMPSDQRSISVRDLEKAKADIEAVENWNEISQKALKVCARLILEYLADEIYDLDHLDCLMSDSSKLWCRILCQLLCGRPYAIEIAAFARIMAQQQQAAG